MDRSLRITGAVALASEGLMPRDIVLRDGCFSDQADSGDRVLPLEGLWLLPGIVDLHGDGFEHHLAPRRGLVTDLARGLEGVSADLARNGITTAWLAQFWSWEGGMRGPEFACRLAEALDRHRARERLDMRLQLRVETHMTDDGAAIRQLIAAHRIGYVVFNDHLPHAHLAAGKTPPRLTGSALKAGRSPDRHLAEMRRLAGQDPVAVASFVRDLVSAPGTAAPRFGSHDDPDASTRARWQALGLDICEFPMSRAAAEAAAAQGAPVIMGAPNVVRGGSHDRRVAAEELIADGLVTALASDYSYPALAQAAFSLADRAILPLAEAWQLISQAPACVMGLSDRGEIAPGKRADLLVVDPEVRRILGCFAGGRPVFLSGALCDRILE